jgi:hypothetical protein
MQTEEKAAARVKSHHVNPRHAKAHRKPHHRHKKSLRAQRD